MGLPAATLDRPSSRLTVSTAVAVAAIAVLNVFDLLTTRVLLTHQGAIEGNPLAALLLTNGTVGLLKAGVIALLVYRVWRRRPTIAFHAVLWFVAGFYALTVFSNLLALQRVS
jgi:hypothetical protein